MTLYEIVDLVKNLGEQTHVNSSFIGDIYELNHRQDIDYPAFVLTQGTHIYNNNDEKDTYVLNIFLVDRLLEDKSNETDIYNWAVEGIENVVKSIETTGIGYVTSSTSINTFTERFDSLCAGAFTTLNIDIDDAICEEPRIVTSVNGKTGDVYIPGIEGDYVESINGESGRVTIDIPKKTSDLINDSDFINSSALDKYNPTDNFKTVNGESIIGKGNIYILDSEMYYGISTPQELLECMNKWNAGQIKQPYIYLKNDIDCSGWEFPGFGTYVEDNFHPFSNCTFDGRGYYLKDVRIHNQNNQCVGFFNNTSKGAVIKNMKFTNLTIDAPNSEFVGFIGLVNSDSGITNNSLNVQYITIKRLDVICDQYGGFVGAIDGRGDTYFSDIYVSNLDIKSNSNSHFFSEFIGNYGTNELYSIAIQPDFYSTGIVGDAFYPNPRNERITIEKDRLYFGLSAEKFTSNKVNRLFSIDDVQGGHLVNLMNGGRISPAVWYLGDSPYYMKPWMLLSDAIIGVPPTYKKAYLDYPNKFTNVNEFVIDGNEVAKIDKNGISENGEYLVNKYATKGEIEGKADKTELENYVDKETYNQFVADQANTDFEQYSLIDNLKTKKADKSALNNYVDKETYNQFVTDQATIDESQNTAIEGLESTKADKSALENYVDNETYNQFVADQAEIDESQNTAIEGLESTKADKTELENYNPTDNFKTINGESIIGTGDIEIQGGGENVFHNDHITDANKWLTKGYNTTSENCSNLPSVDSKWGVILYAPENDTQKTGYQTYVPIAGSSMGRMYRRAFIGREKLSEANQISAGISGSYVEYNSEYNVYIVWCRWDYFTTNRDLVTINGLRIVGTGNIEIPAGNVFTHKSNNLYGTNTFNGKTNLYKTTFNDNVTIINGGLSTDEEEAYRYNHGLVFGGLNCSAPGRGLYYDAKNYNEFGYADEKIVDWANQDASHFYEYGGHYIFHMKHGDTDILLAEITNKGIKENGEFLSDKFASKLSLESLEEKVDELELFKFPNVTIIGQPEISNGQMSGFTTSDYAQFPFLVDFHNQAFEIRMCFTTGNQVTVQENIFDSIDGLAFAVRNGKFVIAMSSDGQTWNMGEHIGQTTILPNTTYYVKFNWNRLVYKLEVSTNKTDYTTDFTVTDARSLFAKQIIIGKSTDNQYIFSGSINLNNCSLSIMGQEVWKGMDDVGLATRLAIDLSNIDAAGEQKVRDIIGEIPTIPTNISAFVNDVGYLTEHQSLEGYAKLTDIPSLDDYYTKSETDGRINGIFEFDEATGTLNITTL